MIRQPFGCLLVLLMAAVSLGLAFGLLRTVHVLSSGRVGWGFGTYCVLSVLWIVPFSVLMELGHRFEIRVFFRKRKVPVRRIRGYASHYRVYFIQDGLLKSGKWPDDFQSWSDR